MWSTTPRPLLGSATVQATHLRWCLCQRCWGCTPSGSAAHSAPRRQRRQTSAPSEWQRHGEQQQGQQQGRHGCRWRLTLFPTTSCPTQFTNTTLKRSRSRRASRFLQSPPFSTLAASSFSVCEQQRAHQQRPRLPLALTARREAQHERAHSGAAEPPHRDHPLHKLDVR